MTQHSTHLAMDDSKRTIVAGTLRPGAQEPNFGSVLRRESSTDTLHQVRVRGVERRAICRDMSQSVGLVFRGRLALDPLPFAAVKLPVLEDVSRHPQSGAEPPLPVSHDPADLARHPPPVTHPSDPPPVSDIPSVSSPVVSGKSQCRSEVKRVGSRRGCGGVTMRKKSSSDEGRSGAVCYPPASEISPVGNQNRMRVPFSGGLSATMRPPCSSTRARQI